MVEAVFHAPRRKRRVFESYDSPFPIPASPEDICGKYFKIYQAEIINNNVIVRNSKDIEQLYSKGYFGKGILSRSRPEYNISDPLLVAKWQDAKINMPILSSKKYQCHLEWAKSLMQEQGLDDCSINKILENYTKPFDLPFMKGEGEVAQNDDSYCRMAAEMENVEDGMKLSRDSSINNGDSAAPNVKCHNMSVNCKTACLEGDSAYHDPLVNCGSEELYPLDTKAIVKVHCQKHDNFIVHCGCKAEDYTNQVFHNQGKEHAYEYVLVQEEESKLCHEDEAANDKSNLIKREKLVCRRNPFRIFEYLQLSLEEAFFLVYALGCLSIYYNEEPLTILKLWEVFSEVQPNFRTTYMAYHYFRSKGWVPKVGLKYGTDLLLYRKGPPFYHASYSVIAELVNDNFVGSLRRPLNWMSLSGLNRTTMNVSKELMLCYLIRPCDMTEKEMSSPDCLKRIKVQELIVNRWVSSRERSEQDEL
ncbi:tRNA-splicing endonuclease subunit Sen2 isoform X1 [Chelonoidis abingdonii]|uniref:tRNA-splicing endonuclease subunit Sen2 isoform X1 n=1 Tax=Chelonoidis abingdonii TaxID=106734 RepID=UPI0013F1EAA8|nr:tRNA-splicing endonuclease subunit Sen2 [Chelonoidis abingdonii]XP_032628452.1 tRNA-splicing endonuclease subunit Sen2 [Chelonoidis abingdonii]XP_032628454.1 tRNA-splicing endonuclease subunit Sen2 [Chelonoidis abingdonii]